MKVHTCEYFSKSGNNQQNTDVEVNCEHKITIVPTKKLSVNIERLDYVKYLKETNTITAVVPDNYNPGSPTELNSEENTAEDTTIPSDIDEEDTVNTENSFNIKSDESVVDFKPEGIKTEYDDDYDENNIVDCGMIIKDEMENIE